MEIDHLVDGVFGEEFVILVVFHHQVGVVEIVKLKFSVFIVVQVSELLTYNQGLKVNERVLDLYIFLGVLLLVSNDDLSGQLALIFMEVLELIESHVLAVLV